MQQQNNFRFFHNGKELSREDFSKLDNGQLIRWFDNNTVRAVDFDSNFFDGGFKSLKDIENYFSSVFPTNELLGEITFSHPLENLNTVKIGANSYIDLSVNPYDDLSKAMEKLHKEGTQEKAREILSEKYSEFGKNGDKTTGVKLNNNKPQMSLLFIQFPKALEAIVRCSEYGNQKYKETDKDFLNFKRVSGGSKTYGDSGLRHRLAKGLDKESSLPHQYHVAWNALAELELWIEENQEKLAQ